MEWVLSDGTRVALGGNVGGDSELASVLRDDVIAARAGRKVLAFRATLPGVAHLDVNDGELVDGWLRSQARRFNVDLLETPEFEARPVAPAVADRVY